MIFTDPGVICLILYGHDQVLEKLDGIRDNVLYNEAITTEISAPKKRKGKSQSTASTSSQTQPAAAEARPSDPSHVDVPVTYPQPEATQGHPLAKLVDIHSEMYFLPDFLTFSNLLAYLHHNYDLQLRPVSTHFP